MLLSILDYFDIAARDKHRLLLRRLYGGADGVHLLHLEYEHACIASLKAIARQDPSVLWVELFDLVLNNIDNPNPF